MLTDRQSVGGLSGGRMGPEGFEFKLLGPLQVWTGGHTVPVRAAKQRVVLASLLVEAPRALTVNQLIARLWGNRVPDGAQGTLRSYVMRLRQALGTTSATGPIITCAEGYYVDLSGHDLDLHRFETLVSYARTATDDGRLDRASALLSDALELWRGEPLTNVPSDILHHHVGTKLNEQWLLARELRIDTALAQGRYHDVIVELSELTMCHPLRERFWAQRMLALYRLGRQAEALECYRKLRELLAAELGIDPSAELQSLHQAILGNDPSLGQACPHRTDRLPEVQRVHAQRFRASTTVDVAGAATATATSEISDAAGGSAKPGRPVTDAGGYLHTHRQVVQELELLERERELQTLDVHISRACRGTGQLLLVEGAAGIGKTRLLAAARAQAQQAGMQVLVARGSELEREFAYGVARQLFEPVFTRIDKLERADLLAGAAAQTQVLFQGAEAAAVTSDRSFALLHGLYWLTANLAQKPLMLNIDDLHWSDAPSLRFLAYLLPRLGGLPLLLVVGMRSAEPTVDQHLIGQITTDPLTTVLRPAPLSEGASTQLVRTVLANDADDAFCGACHAATGGNPLLLHELVAAAAGEGLEPTTADVVRLLELGPRAMKRRMAWRLSQLAPPAAAFREPDELPAGAAQRVVSAQVQGITEVVGRAQELLTLRAGFTDPTRPPRPVLRVLTGLGGIGKTTLARAYAQRYQEHYQLVWWIAAEDLDAAAGDFRALLDVLDPQYAQRTHDPVQAVHALLANCTRPWLLVIDNVAEPDALRGLVPAAGPGDVLVTSRAGTWPDWRIVVPVQPLIHTDAMQLILALSGDTDHDSAAALVHELGGLPLALAQAGCYAAHSGLDLSGYVALYRNRRAELHKQGNAPDYPDTVATTWQLAFDQLTPPARALLNLLAWYAPEAFPLDPLLAPDPGRLTLPEPVTLLVTDPLHQHRAITELIAYGLITRAGPRGSVTVHCLVQAVTADQLTTTNQHTAWITAAATLLEAACPPMPTTTWAATRVPITRATITTWQSLQAHLRAVIDHLNPDQPLSLNLRFLLTDWTGTTGNFVRAQELAAAVTEDMTRVLGPDDIHTLWARSGLAYWTGQAGDVARARELAAVLVNDMTRVLGPTHWYTLFVVGNYIRWTALSGDFGHARQLASAKIEELEQELHVDDPFMLIARAHLARWTGEAGDVALARQLAATVLADTQQVFGPDHPRTLAARENLLRWTGEAGDPAGARQLAIALVADDERILGPEHRHTLLARAHLVRWTGEAGHPAQARKLAAALVDDCERILGPDHRYTLLAQTHLARWSEPGL